MQSNFETELNSYLQKTKKDIAFKRGYIKELEEKNEALSSELDTMKLKYARENESEADRNCN